MLFSIMTKQGGERKGKILKIRGKTDFSNFKLPLFGNKILLNKENTKYC